MEFIYFVVRMFLFSGSGCEATCKLPLTMMMASRWNEQGVVVYMLYLNWLSKCLGSTQRTIGIPFVRPANIFFYITLRSSKTHARLRFAKTSMSFCVYRTHSMLSHLLVCFVPMLFVCYISFWGYGGGGSGKLRETFKFDRWQKFVLSFFFIIIIWGKSISCT